MIFAIRAGLHAATHHKRAIEQFTRHGFNCANPLYFEKSVSKGEASRITGKCDKQADVVTALGHRKRALSHPCHSYFGAKHAVSIQCHTALRQLAALIRNNLAVVGKRPGRNQFDIAAKFGDGA
jgi:hypothetical protein